MTNKPWYRPRNLLLAVVTVVLGAVGWFAWQVGRVYWAEANPRVNYRETFWRKSEPIAGLSPEHAEEAWSTFVDAVQRATEVHTALDERPRSSFEPRFEQDFLYFDYELVRIRHLLTDDFGREREAISLLREAGVFDRLRRLAEIGPGLVPTTGEGLMLQEAMNLAGARGLANARIASMRLAFFDDEQVEIAAAFEQVLALARTISFQPGLFGYLSASNIEHMALEELRYELIEADIAETTCRRLIDALDRQPLAPLSLVIEGERCVYHDFVQRRTAKTGSSCRGHWKPRAPWTNSVPPC